MCQDRVELELVDGRRRGYTLALKPRHVTAPPKKQAKTAISVGEDVGYRCRKVNDAYPASKPNPTAPRR